MGVVTLVMMITPNRFLKIAVLAPTDMKNKGDVGLKMNDRSNMKV